MTKKINKINKREKYNIKYFSVLKKAEDIAIFVLSKVEKMKEIKGAEFKRKTKELKEIYQKNNNLDEIIIDAFALAYRAIEEIYGISLYKVQIMGAYGLHLGDVSEMKTGEGKTLTAILPAFLNSLTGKPVHIITVNEYLSTRDAFNTSKVFSLLGITCGSITSQISNDEKREIYKKDIVYLTNSELGFDYLKDNLVRRIEDKVQREFNYVIIDEVDSILIDEARTPLIISGGKVNDDLDYINVDNFVKSLVHGDYTIDKETKQSFLTETGMEKAKKFFNTTNLYSFSNSKLVHLISNGLQANYIYKNDVDYTVKDEKIVLIDSFTGRLLEGRQFSEGLNQAIEAKENVPIVPETKLFASITYQNLFRMYKKISGMTGTALSEEEEFLEIYNMRVLSIPTNLPVIRNDLPDVIFATKKAKNKSIIKKIIEIHETGQPILVGTRSVSESEIISEGLNELNISHEILNAKNHSREAEIIKKAGEKNQITIATNMAGRGTDIKLGKGVSELGGLFVLGTERNESRRIDNQLRGRSGRQGDIGYSQFYISLDDEIMQRAGLKRVQKFLKSIDENPIESRSIQRSITIAQKKIEGLNFDYRKSIVEYDDVLNSQRIITYKQRDSILKLKEYEKVIKTTFNSYINNLSLEKFCYIEGNFSSKLFLEKLSNDFKVKFNNTDDLSLNKTKEISYNTILDKFFDKIENWKNNNLDVINFIKSIFLISLDMNWQEQIERLNKLKSGIRYQQYAQKNPIQIYVQEADKLLSLYKKQIVEQNTITLMTIDPLNQLHVEEKILNKQEKVKELIVK